ncbi:MAG TPA: XRE family transcriptional regulator [Kofleriaceae bacterium]|jgi:Zn-dependent peptidase ImmA (M78 family)/DNA-binding XRE family transcriptional regulator
MANSWEELGKQIASARNDRRLTQTELAAALDVDRTVISKIETGERKVDSFELARFAAVLRRPVRWFLDEASPSVVSRRAERKELVRGADIELETLALDVEQVIGLGLVPPTFPAFELHSIDDTEAAATLARERADLRADEPVWNLVQVVERLGLFAFVLPLDPDIGAPAEGSYVALARGGVALINARGQSGRRRFTIAHELGHHVLADEYAPEWVVGAGSSDAEKIINAFAIHFLMPRDGVISRWTRLAGASDPRGAAIRIAAEFGVSWSAACAQLERLGLLTTAQFQQLVVANPNAADFAEHEAVVRDDVVGPNIPPAYASAVIRALRKGKIGPQRAVELLYGTVAGRDLPFARPLSLDEMLPDLEPLP